MVITRYMGLGINGGGTEDDKPGICRYKQRDRGAVF